MSIQYGGDKITFQDGSTVASGFTGFKNRIINGAMVIDQRNAGASVTIPSSATTYTVDRWQCYATQASKFTVQQNAGSVTPPAGFTKYAGITSSSAYSVASGDFFVFGQIIEGFNAADFGWGAAGAQSITISFQVRSSLTGTFGGVITNGAQNRSYPFTFTVSSANTWETKTVTIAGDTSGTWATGNTSSISLYFSMGSGSTYSGTAGAWAGSNYYSATGATSVVGTSGATFYITGVQLEKGSTATSFDYREYGEELRKCQRYCFSIVGGSGDRIGNGIVGATGNGYVGITPQVAMRAGPTIESLSSIQFNDGIAAYTASSTNIVTSLPQYVIIYGAIAGATAGKAIQVYFTNSSSKLLLTAEL